MMHRFVIGISLGLLVSTGLAPRAAAAMPPQQGGAQTTAVNDPIIQRLPTILIGTWRDSNSVSEYRPDGTMIMTWDTGRQAIGTWSVRGLELRRSYTRVRQLNSTMWMGTSGGGVDTVLHATQDRIDTRDETGAFWTLARQTGQVAPTGPVDNVMKAAQSHFAGMATSATEAEIAFQATKAKNAAAVRVLLAHVTAMPTIAPAFTSCVAMHGKAMDAFVATYGADVKTNSESKTAIQNVENEAKAYAAEKTPLVEGVCAWKVVAWMKGVPAFDPNVFVSDARLGEWGATRTAATVYELQCRQAGDPMKVYSEISLNCATALALKADSALKNPDLTEKAYDRLRTLLVAPLPQTFAIFTEMAMLGFGYTRMSPEHLAQLCGARC